MVTTKKKTTKPEDAHTVHDLQRFYREYWD